MYLGRDITNPNILLVASVCHRWDTLRLDNWGGSEEQILFSLRFVYYH